MSQQDRELRPEEMDGKTVFHIQFIEPRVRFIKTIKQYHKIKVNLKI